LLQRLGRDCTLAIWRSVYTDYDDKYLRQILKGWEPVQQDHSTDVEESIAEQFPGIFPVAVEGVSQQEARNLVEEMPPIKQVREAFRHLDERKQVTAYEALHLRADGQALLTEALLQLQGKQGELIAYDVLREGRIKSVGGKTGTVAEFMADFVSEPEEDNIFTAGLETEIIYASPQEVVVHIKECAWARYFQERHPRVGYLMACSTDEVAYRAFNEGLRMRRTSTLMEGGKVCDFRIYADDQAPDAH
jgi:hypothetical protein